MRNIELKARCQDTSRAARICQDLGCSDLGLEEQVDTYFTVKGGRLKLREGSLSGSRLIYYDRKDAVDPRASDYLIYSITAPSAELKQILCHALSVRTTVRKLRHVFLLGQLRVHLDEVEHLGTFIEFEYVVKESTDSVDGVAIVEDMCKRFSIKREEIIAQSYCDLIEERRTV